MYENDGEAMPADQEVDRRVLAMQRVVDLEHQHSWAQRDADERQKKAALIGDELAEARDELHSLLGLPSRAMNVSAMSREEAKRIAADRFPR
ncbi:hypothetical protein [Blastococcus sp. SYSU D00813]